MQKPDLIDRKAVISLLHYFTDEACSSIVGDVEKLPSVDANPKNRVLALEELSERTDPVWVETPDAPWIEDGGYYCLCDHGSILAPSGYRFLAKDRDWVFLDRKPTDEERAAATWEEVVT